MTELTLGQALRNAVETELAAERYYRRLAAHTTDPDARLFLLGMADEEHEHAAELERFGVTVAVELPGRADPNVHLGETAPGWAHHEGTTLDQALRIALEAENNAALYYDALAGTATGAVADFFRRLVANEEDHAARLRAMIARAAE
ncbi:MAG TPA: ferritin family protein [Polyangia bacterium]